MTIQEITTIKPTAPIKPQKSPQQRRAERVKREREQLAKAQANVRKQQDDLNNAQRSTY